LKGIGVDRAEAVVFVVPSNSAWIPPAFVTASPAPFTSPRAKPSATLETSIDEVLNEEELPRSVLALDDNCDRVPFSRKLFVSPKAKLCATEARSSPVGVVTVLASCRPRPTAAPWPSPLPKPCAAGASIPENVRFRLLEFELEKLDPKLAKVPFVKKLFVSS